MRGSLAGNVGGRPEGGGFRDLHCRQPPLQLSGGFGSQLDGQPDVCLVARDGCISRASVSAAARREANVKKHRASAVLGTNLKTVLRAHKTDNSLMMSHASSGVILSTVPYAADFKSVVVEDGCGKPEREVHEMLLQGGICPTGIDEKF